MECYVYPAKRLRNLWNFGVPWLTCSRLLVKQQRLGTKIKRTKAVLLLLLLLLLRLPLLLVLLLHLLLSVAMMSKHWSVNISDLISNQTGMRIDFCVFPPLAQFRIKKAGNQGASESFLDSIACMRSFLKIPVGCSQIKLVGLSPKTNIMFSSSLYLPNNIFYIWNC